jgi:tRNA(Ile)-lysidine synthase
MKILAVSGGIDSVVMLDYLAHNCDEELFVAHFDHGIRQNSHEDAQFVERLAGKYQLPFACKRAELGAGCSEATAREARYDFLLSCANKHNASLCVAHHADDIIESIAINLLRGTGWRGLAPMQNAVVERPLRTWRKAEIYRYAAEHKLSFRQDPTNVEDEYLRNRVREHLRDFPESSKEKLLELYEKQCQLKEGINGILASIPHQARYEKTLAEEQEILRHILALHDVHLTRPQLANCQQAIASLAPGKRHSLDKTHFIKVNKYSFELV